MGIHEAQLIQESLDLVRVRLVPGEGYGDPDRAAIRRAVQERMGDVNVVFDAVPAIPRGSNGKLRAVISHLPPNFKVATTMSAKVATSP